jgi:uncharacterized protein with HEPN domain
MREINERLYNILEAITCIEKYTQNGRTSFDKDELVQTWVIHHLEIIGEAARALPQDYRSSHPGTNWRQIGGMRNIHVHMYFGIDQECCLGCRRA